MPLLNTADNLYAGADLADKAYQGDVLVWERAPLTYWDFESGTSTETVDEYGITNLGVPVYGAGVGTPLGVSLVGSANGLELLHSLSGDHSGSMQVRVDTNHTSSALRTLLVKDSLYGWLSGMRHHNGGNLQVLNGTSSVEVLGDWRPYSGVDTRIEWEYTAATGTFVWKFYATALGTTPLWTSSPIVNASKPAAMISVGSNGGPGTGDFTVDDIRIWKPVG